MEKEQADAAYRQAAASETHSASLGAVEETSFSVKLDKVPPGVTATFGVKLLQSGGLKSFGEVVANGDAPASTIADLAVLPSFAPLDSRGIPFEFTLLFDRTFRVVLPSVDVLRHESETMLQPGGMGRGQMLPMTPRPLPPPLLPPLLAPQLAAAASATAIACCHRRCRRHSPRHAIRCSRDLARRDWQRPSWTWRL